MVERDVLKIEYENKSDVEIINKKITKIIIFNVVVSLVFVISFSFVGKLDEPYNYLIVSPSFYNYAYLNWVSSAWIGLLGIHGTIAALSITFMGMFVGQASSFSEYGFESLSKVYLLRKHNFLEFSMQSVCNLLCGIFLMLVGCGLLAYLFSAFMSLYFIIQYAVMYYRLYNLTEDPGVISNLLLGSIKETGQEYNSINQFGIKINGEFESYCKKYDFFSTNQTANYWDEKLVALDVFPSSKNIIITGFYPEIFDELAKIFISFNEDSRPVICFYFAFFYPSPNYSIKILIPSDFSLSNENIILIKNILKKAIIINEVPHIFNKFKQFEDALVNNIRNTLINGDEWSLDFGVKAFYELTSSFNYLNTLKNIDSSIGLSNNKDIVKSSLLASFFEKMCNEALKRGDVRKCADVMRCLLDLARYIYSKNIFYEFYKLAFKQIEFKVKYRSEEEDYIFLDLYAHNVLYNLVYANYKAFEIDTAFMTAGIRYLDLHHRLDHESINDTQRKFLQCLFEVITLLIVRAEFIFKNAQSNKDELDFIRKFLKLWLNAKFLEELYFKSESYEVLFSIPKEYSITHAEFQLREVPDGEASWRSISNDTHKMIALFLTQSPCNSNRFNLIFFNDVKKLKASNFMTTHNLESILSYLESDDFNAFLNMLNQSQDITDQKNRHEVAERVRLMISELKSLILQEVISAELDAALVTDYIEKLKDSFSKEFELIASGIVVTPEKNTKSEVFKFLINKREVLPPIDGTAYGSNVSNIARNLIYQWLYIVLDMLKEINCTVKEIGSTDDLTTTKVISIIYMVEQEANTYKHIRGLKIVDKLGHLQLGGPGIYYVNLSENFLIVKNNDLIDVEIKKIEEVDLDAVNDLMNLGGENPHLYSILNAMINVSAVPKDIVNLYFLSEKNCQLNNERLEREVGQLFNNVQGTNNDGSIS